MPSITLFLLFFFNILCSVLISRAWASPSLASSSSSGAAAIGPSYQTEKQQRPFPPAPPPFLKSGRGNVVQEEISAAAAVTGGSQQQKQPSPPTSVAAATPVPMGSAAVAVGNVMPQSSSSAAVSGSSGAVEENAGISGRKQYFLQKSDNQTAAATDTSAFDATYVLDDNTAANCEGPRQCANLNGRRDFNPALSAGTGEPAGIKARLNPSAFQTLSRDLPAILNYQIKRFQLPEISQCLPQVSGCIRVRNLHITNYRCTNDVSLRPGPSNQLILDVNGVDISVNGNLGGQITIMVPLLLYGQVQVNVQRVHVRVGVIPVSNGTSPMLRMASCSASVGRIQMNIQNGGLLGDIARQQLQAKLTRIVRQQVSSQLCRRVPQILDEQINSKIPSLIPSKLPLDVLVTRLMNSGCFERLSGLGTGDEETAEEATTTSTFVLLKRKMLLLHHRRVARSSSSTCTSGGGDSTSGMKKKQRRAIASIFAPVRLHEGGKDRTSNDKKQNRRQSTKTDEDDDQWITADPEPSTTTAAIVADDSTGADNGEATTTAALDLGGGDATGETGTTAEGDKPIDFGTVLRELVDIGKFANLFINLQFINGFSAPNGDYTVGIEGSASLCSWGCTPFRPFPTQIPPCSGAGCKMVDALLSDYTINSLLYHLYRDGFFVFNVGPDTSEIGKLMVLNCEDAQTEGEEGGSGGIFFLEDHGVELDEEDGLANVNGTANANENNGTITKNGTALTARRRTTAAKSRRQMKKTKKTMMSRRKQIMRNRRQLEAGEEEGGGGMSVNTILGFGFCAGSLLPRAKEKAIEEDRKEKLDIKLHATQAPSVIIHANGSIIVTFVADIDFFADSTKEKITTLHLDAQLLVNVNISEGNNVTASVEVLNNNVRDVGGGSGLDADQMKTYVDLLQGFLLQDLNSKLEKGCPLEVPSLEGAISVPLEIQNLGIGFVDHAVHVQLDFSLKLDESSGFPTEPCVATAG